MSQMINNTISNQNIVEMFEMRILIYLLHY